MGSRLDRFSDAHETMRYLKTCPALVRCHRCDALAIVKCGHTSCSECGYNGVPNPHDVERLTHRIEAKCPDCRLWLTWQGKRNASGIKLLRCRCGGSRQFDMTKLRVGEWSRGQEPRTGLTLWLQADFRGRLLWAVNWSHLNFLQRFVAAGIREQSPGNSTQVSRLPAWIKSAKNRPDLLKTLRRMESSLPPGYHEPPAHL